MAAFTCRDVEHRRSGRTGGAEGHAVRRSVRQLNVREFGHDSDVWVQWDHGAAISPQSRAPIGAITTPTSTLNGAPVSINACLGGSIPGASCTMDSDCTGGGTCVLNPNFQPINLYLCTGGSNPGANCLGASDVTSCTGGGARGVNPSFPPVKLYDCMGGSNGGASCTGTNDVTSCTGGGTCTLVNMYACVDGTNPGAACTGPSDVTSCTGGGKPA